MGKMDDMRFGRDSTEHYCNDGSC